MAEASTTQPYDALIIGGGPAGATAALVAARKGLRVALFEKSRFPRFHIGESLLPRNYTLLEELGLMDALARVPHVPKFGAEFGMAGDTKTSMFSFDTGFVPGGRTLNIERGLFDKVVLDAAREAGAEIHEQTGVKRIVKLEDGDVRIQLESGEEVAGRWLLDGSGQSTIVARHLGVRKPPSEKHLQKIAYFGHFENVMRLSGREEGHPLIVMSEEAWFWFIPINSKVMSIGMVLDAHIAKQIIASGVSPDRMLQWGLARTPLTRERCKDAIGPEKNEVIANFSYRCDPFAGAGHFMIGDSAAFVDPIFSTGVCLGMMEGQLAADLVSELVAGKIRPDAARRKYVDFVSRGKALFFELIATYYRHSFRELFLHGYGPHDIHRAVLSILAGNIFPRPHWRLRWRYQLFRLCVRLNEKFCLVPRREKYSLLSEQAEMLGKMPFGMRLEPDFEPAETPTLATAAVE